MVNRFKDACIDKKIKMLTYQNFTYNAPINKNITMINAQVDGESLNIFLSSSNALGFILGPAILIAIITSMVMVKESPMQMWNGISYALSSDE